MPSKAATKGTVYINHTTEQINRHSLYISKLFHVSLVSSNSLNIHRVRLDFSLIDVDTHVSPRSGRGVRQTSKSSNGNSLATSKARAIPCKFYLRVPRARPYRVCSQRPAIFKTSIDSGRDRRGQLWFRFVLYLLYRVDEVSQFRRTNNLCSRPRDTITRVSLESDPPLVQIELRGAAWASRRATTSFVTDVMSFDAKLYLYSDQYQLYVINSTIYPNARV